MFENGQFFDFDLQKKIRDEFYFLDCDGDAGKRLFFDNSGGALRLKRAVEAKALFEAYPDCPERGHRRGVELKKLVLEGTREIKEIVFGASSGAVITELTASQVMFHIVELILENVDGTNAVVSALEHPSAFDAVEYYCRKTGKEMRVAPARTDGAVHPEDVAALVDENTVLVSVMAASNVSGNIMDIEGIVKSVREKKPDVYVISDAVQHAPHAVIDVESLGVDAMNFAPYKFFGVRGCGFGWVSDRVARLPHRKLIKKDADVFELGTSAPGNFAAMLEVISYVCEIGAYYINSNNRRELWREGMKRIHLQERALLNRLLEGSDRARGLRYIKGARVLVDSDDLTHRDLIVALELENVSFSEAVKKYEGNGVIVCDRVLESMYAERILRALSLKGALRISPLHCHTPEDIDEFLEITERIAK